MTNAVEITLAALVGLAANFHDGLDQLKNKNYDKAIAAFTPVIEAAPSVADMRDFALLYRAEAFAVKGNKPGALKDAATLLKSTDDAAVKRQAAAVYTGQGGLLADLRPKDSPKAALDQFFALVRNNDTQAAKQKISGALREWLDTADRVIGEGRRSFLSEIGRHPEELAFVSESFDDTNQTATLTVAVDRGNLTFTLGLVQVDGKWAAASVVDASNAREQRRAAGGVGGRPAMSGLQQLGRTLVMYSMDHGEAFPAQWEDLKDYGGSSALYLCVDPATGKKEKYLYRAGLKPGNGSLMIAAAPFVTNGRREVLFVDGHVESLAEDDFVQKAKKQKWDLPMLIKKEDVDKAVAAEVADLIGKLGDKESRVRAAARNRLKEIGPAARPFLKEQENNADPEIQTAVRELLR